MNDAIRDLANQRTQWNRHDAKQQAPSPLGTCKRTGVERFTTLKNDDELTRHRDELHSNEPWIAQDPLVIDIEFVVYPAAVVLVEELHPHIDVEHQSLKLLDLKLGVRVEQVPSGVMHSEDDCQLVHGLAQDHLPHGDADNRGVARLGLPLQEIR